MSSTTEILEEIAAMGGEVGDEAARLLPLTPPKLCGHPGDKYLRAVRRWLDDIERVVWRAQSDPVLRPHCEEFTRLCVIDTMKAAFDDCASRIAGRAKDE